MKNRVARIGMITGALAVEAVFLTTVNTTADTVGLSTAVCEEVQLAGPMVMEVSNNVITDEIIKWRAENALQKEAQRVRQEKKKQKHCIKEKKERLHREKVKRERERRKKQEAARRQAIKKACGSVIGTESERILCRIVEAEAGGEDKEGRMLVANVILNRVIHQRFPNTIKEVVFAHGGSTYQFSPVSNGSYYRVHVSEGTRQAVKAALQGKDSSQGALYFMERALADSGNVSWFDRCLTRLFRYGCHEFYK